MRNLPLLLHPPMWHIEKRPQFNGEPLDEAHPFVVTPSPQGKVTHRPRAAHRYPGRIAYWLWCGNSIHDGIGLYFPQQGRPVCGTCEGRAIGAGWPTSEQIITGRTAEPWPRTRFTPRPLFDPPRWCPGRFWIDDPSNWRRGTCLECHADVKLRSKGTWHRPSWGPEQHEPYQMIPPCRRHGWLRTTWLDRSTHTIGCACRLPKEDHAP